MGGRKRRNGMKTMYGNELEIVSNIHDNPELVRKDEENESSYKSD